MPTMTQGPARADADTRPEAAPSPTHRLSRLIVGECRDRRHGWALFWRHELADLAGAEPVAG
jgi:hypothetical protein